MGKVQSNKTQVNFHIGEGKTSPVGITNLIVESYYLQGARNMLSKLLDNYKIVPKEKIDKDDTIYTKAELDLIISDKCETRNFLIYGRNGIHYYNHERNKKGKLTKVKAKYGGL